MKRHITCALILGLMLLLPFSDAWARGFGGGGRGGGGGARGGFGGGGFSGGGMSRGGMGGGGLSGGGGISRGGMAGGGFGGGGSFSGPGGNLGGAGGINRGDLGGRNLGGGGGISRGDLGGGGLGGGNLGGGGLAGQRSSGALGGAGGARGGLSQDSFGDRFSGSAPSRDQLGSFLGLPSDGGMQHLSSGAGDNFDVNHGSKEGPRGGTASGTSITGPGGNTVYRGGAEGARGGEIGTRGVAGADGRSARQTAAVGPDGGAAARESVTGRDGNTAFRGAAVGPDGGVAAGRGVRGADGGSARGGAVVGPDGRAAAGRAVRGPDGGFAARGAAVGPGGYARGFAAVSPSGRYRTASVVRTNFNHWDVYGRGWYTNHPGAWFAAGWAAGRAWDYCTWGTLEPYMGYYSEQPIYYDYGTNVTYQDNSVYVNGQDAGTAEEYYNQAEQLATDGGQADAPDDGDWLPLGVFAMSPSDKKDSNMVIQLAVNKEGIIRGNFTDTQTGTTEVVQGSVDKKTQRAAWTIGDNESRVVETGLYNLTKEEAPCLVHLGADQTEQWLLVRLDKDQQQDQASQ